MKNTHDLSTTKEEEIKNKATELGWSKKSYEIERTYITQNDLSQIKSKIRDNKNTLTIFKGRRDRKKVREVTKLKNLDLIQNPGKQERFRGIDKPSAKNAAENDITFLFTFEYLGKGSKKDKVRKLNDFRESIKVCNKYGAKYCLGTGAKRKNDLRSPENLKRFISSMGGEPKKSLEEWPRDIVSEVIDE